MKRIAAILAGLLCCCSLGACTGSLPAVTNITYADGILSFDEVAGATGYEVSFSHGDELLYEDTVDVTSLDIESFGMEGGLNVVVRAVAGKAKSAPVSFDFTVLSTFGDVEFEAEEYLSNYGTGKSNSNYRNNPLAHRGGYVGGLDDAGQGIYINYLCPFAGTFELDAYYLHSDRPDGQKTAHHDVRVNGYAQEGFDYTENTGWGGDNFRPAKATINVTLQQGWNTISIMKNGTKADNWGSFAELDYLVLKGNGEKYNVDDLAKYGSRPPFYRLEAEMGSPRKKNKISYTVECKNPCIAEDDTHKYSNGFLMGSIESTYDGVEWQFNSPVKAKYLVAISYASQYFSAEESEDGVEAKPARPTFAVTQTEVLLFEGKKFRDMETAVTMDELPYTGWNKPTVANETVEIVLEAGKNFIYCVKLSNSGFFQIDYVDLVFLGEVE